MISDKIKVNDLRGNPIEMAAQVVWRVTDTAQALFDVDDYKEFVMAQIEAGGAVDRSRAILCDDSGHQGASRCAAITTRSGSSSARR